MTPWATPLPHTYGSSFPSLWVLIFSSFFLFGCAGKSSSTVARNAAVGQELVDSAMAVLRSNLEGEKKDVLNSLIARAKGVMIIPAMGDVSFFFSLGGGSAVVMARTAHGWSGPAFLSKGTGGIGAQAGVTRMSGVILYMDAEDVRYVLETGGVFQGRAAITLLDEDYEGNRTPEFYETGDVVFIGETSGLFAGIGIRGGGLSNRDGLNAAYHDVKDGSPENVLYNTAEVPAGARHLCDLLDMAEAAAKASAGENNGRKK